MREIVDLSGLIESGMWGYHQLPGLEEIVPETSIEPFATIRENGFFSSKIIIATISGSYIESGTHMIENARNLDEYSVKDFIKPAKIIRIPGIREKSVVTGEMLEVNTDVKIEKGDALLIDTGYGERWNKPGYVLKGPNYSQDALEWVIDKDISILGVDVPCIEGQWSEGEDEGKGSLIKALFKKGVLLVAPLVNLDKIKSKIGTIYCLPINIKGTSGAPGRIVFIGNEE